MADIERIGAQQANTKAKSREALLVCAYEDEAKCRMLNLEGSMSFASFKSRVCGNTPGSVIGQAASGSSLRWLAYRLTDPDSWPCMRRASEEMVNANFTRTVWRITYLQLACSDFAP
jgi:hypothetical protein